MDSTAIVRVVVAYAVLASLWVLTSSEFAYFIFPRADTLRYIELVKGLAFVAVTAIVLSALLSSMRRAERERYRVLFNGHDAAILLLDAESDAVIDANPAAVAFFGRSRQNLLAMPASAFVDLPTASTRQKVLGEIRRGGTTRVRLAIANSTLRDIEVAWGPAFIDGRMLVYAIMHDDTERLRAEAAANELSDRLRHYLAVSPVIMYALAIDGDDVRPIWVSENIERILGYTPQEALHPTWWLTHLHWEDRERELAYLNELLHGNISRQEYRFRHKDDSLLWVLDNQKLVRDEHGAPLQVVGAWTDISERRQAEIALAEHVRMLAESQRIVNLGSWEIDLGTYAVTWSDQTYRIFDVSRESFAHTFEALLACLHEEDQPAMRAWTAALVAREQPGERVFRVVDSAQQIRFISTRGEAEYGSNGKPVRVIGTMHDVSDMNRAQQSLRDSEARLRRAVEEAPFPMAIHAEDGEILFVSRAWTDISGYTLEEVPTVMAWTERAYGAHAAAVRAEIATLYGLDRRKDDGEFEITCRDGSQRIWSFGSVSLGQLPDGRRICVSMAADVTERNRVTAALRKSEARYRELFESNPHPMWVYDLETLRFLAVNDAAAQHYGYRHAELLGMTVRDIRPAEDIPRLLDSIAAVTDDTPQDRGLWRHRKRDGTLIDVEIRSHVLEYEGRRAELVLANDVTEQLASRRQTEADEARFRALAEQSLAGIYSIEDGRITYTNPRTAEIFGYSVEALRGMPILDLVAEQDRALVSDKIQQRMSGALASAKYEFLGLRGDGTNVAVGVHGAVALIDGKRVIIGVLQDITEKRRADTTIQEYISRLERAVLETVNAVSHMVELRDPYTAGHERRVGILAAQIAAEMGLDENTQRGLRIAGALHDVGKITVPAEILSKPSRLSAIEFEMVKAHAEQGYEVLKDVDFPWPVAEVARQHHERIDGSGYPRGLKGDAILLEARIIGIADVVESMASHRPYRPGLGIEMALAEIERNSGKLYDKPAAAACLRLFKDKGYTLPA